MSENWKPVPSYESAYEVSDRGRVRRICDFGPRSRKPPYVLKAQRHNHGYLIVTLHAGAVDGKRRQRVFLVHRLVAEAFLGPSTLSVNHKNGDKHDNHLDNLEHISLRDNAKHSISAGLSPSYNKRFNTPEMTRRIFELRAQGWSQQRIADTVGSCQVRISQILRAKNIN